MTREEFKTWADDFSKRFPASGDWLGGLSTATRQVWFEDCFSSLELRDCLAVNRQIMLAGELEAYRREHLPAIFIKGCQDLAHAREQRAEARRPQQREESLSGTKRTFTPVMRRVLNRVESEQRRYRQDHVGERMPDSDCLSLVDSLMRQLDQDDDETTSPRFKCLDCRDSGFVHFRDSKQRPMCGHCSCALGISRRDAFHEHGRVLGAAVQDKAVEWAFE